MRGLLAVFDHLSSNSNNITVAAVTDITVAISTDVSVAVVAVNFFVMLPHF